MPRCISGSQLPPRLRDLPVAPNRVYVEGPLPIRPGVAIVGTRQPTKEAEAYARKLAKQLAREGVTILSGGALGIDTAAHEGALDAGGSTVVVVPASLDQLYPTENQPLFKQILDSDGVLLSLWEADRGAHYSTFFARNAALAALCHALIVVEAPMRSGSRNAAKWARRLGRPLFVVPATPWNVRGRGCILELQAGARPLLSYKELLTCLREQRVFVSSSHDPALQAAPSAKDARPAEGRAEAKAQMSLFDGSRQQPVDPHASEPAAGGVSESERWVARFAAGPRHVDVLAQECGLPLPELQQMLLRLCLDGVLRALPTGEYCLDDVRQHVPGSQGHPESHRRPESQQKKS